MYQLLNVSPVVNFALKLLVREQKVVQKAVKHQTVGHVHSGY